MALSTVEVAVTENPTGSGTHVSALPPARSWNPPHDVVTSVKVAVMLSPKVPRVTSINAAENMCAMATSTGALVRGLSRDT